MKTSEIETLSPGVLTTVQDLGRFGYAHLGISPSGAADALSLRIANRIVGNIENAAGLEMTLVGATLRFRQSCTIALAGAPVASSAVPMFEPITVDKDYVLECGQLRDGARTYLAVAGGLNVPEVLGSASTLLGGGFGGFHGRALKRGDILEVGSRIGEQSSANVSKLCDLATSRKTIRVTRGPQRHLFEEEEIERFCAAEYVVTEQSNRLGLRLAGTVLKRRVAGELLTEGVSLGAIQIPPNGQPIVLFVDQQTTGGYPKLANVIAADLHCLGQLRPRDKVRFELVSIEEAVQALREQERTFVEAFSS